VGCPYLSGLWQSANASRRVTHIPRLHRVSGRGSCTLATTREESIINQFFQDFHRVSHDILVTRTHGNKKRATHHCVARGGNGMWTTTSLGSVGTLCPRHPQPNTSLLSSDVSERTHSTPQRHSSVRRSLSFDTQE
jgi:hypothetical protein